MGSGLFEVGEVLGARGNTKAKKMRNGGTLFVRITPAPVDSAGTLHLNMRGVKLKNVEGLFGKSDPFVEISAKVNAAGGLTWQPVYRSKPVMNNLNPNWPPFSLDLSRLCDGDLDKPVLVELWDWEKNGKHTPMGKFETSVNGLLAAAVPGADGGPQKGVDTSKAFQVTKKNKAIGQVVVTTAKLEGTSGSSTSQSTSAVVPMQPPTSDVPSFSQSLDRPAPTMQNTANVVSAAAAMSKLNLSKPVSAPVPYVAPVPAGASSLAYSALPPPMAPPTLKPTFVDYVTGGCELELQIAIDFTGSNGDPRRPGTLHYLHPDGQLNDYEKAISAVGGILSKYDSDQKFPVFGFGAKYGGVIQHCFQIGGKPELDGISGVLEAYRGVFRTGLTMSGPTVFAEVINYAAQTARSKQDASQRIGQQAYKILLILTDGAVTDVEQTKRAIHAASDAPLSIVIVGIGSADFSAMQELDDFLANDTSLRDIVQFVEFSPHAFDKSSLTRATLEEIPDQLVDYFYNRGIMPLPPIRGSQISLYPEECTDEDIDLSIDISPEGEINLTDYDGTYQFDDTKYNTMADYSAVVPMPPPSAPSAAAPFVPQQQQQQQPAYYSGVPAPAPRPTLQQHVVARPPDPPPEQPEVFHVQVPPNVTPGMQLQIQHPRTRQQMIVTIPQGVGPGGKFAVRY